MTSEQGKGEGGHVHTKKSRRSKQPATFPSPTPLIACRITSPVRSARPSTKSVRGTHTEVTTCEKETVMTYEGTFRCGAATPNAEIVRFETTRERLRDFADKGGGILILRGRHT